MITGSISKAAWSAGFRLRTFTGVLDIPEARSGKYRIEHFEVPAGDRLELASARTRILGGHAAGFITHDVPTRWHRLVGPTGVWMTDLPVEQAQHDAALKGVTRGSVLVGGLGIGYAVQLLAKRKDIERIIVIEVSRDVIALVKPALFKMLGKHADKVTIVHADLLRWLTLRQHIKNASLDFAFYDIWQGDDEATLHEIVVPLLSLSAGIVKTRPICWNEDVMRGQLRNALMHATLTSVPAVELPPSHPGARYVNWRVPFHRWVEERKPDEALMQQMAVSYAELYGTVGGAQKWRALVDAVRVDGVTP